MPGVRLSPAAVWQPAQASSNSSAPASTPARPASSAQAEIKTAQAARPVAANLVNPGSFMKRLRKPLGGRAYRPGILP